MRWAALDKCYANQPSRPSWPLYWRPNFPSISGLTPVLFIIVSLCKCDSGSRLYNFKLREGSFQALVFLLVPSRACPPPPAGHHTRDDFAVQMSRWIMEQLSGLMTHFNTDIYILKRILYISLFFRQNNNAPSSYSLFTGHCMTVTRGGGF